MKKILTILFLFTISFVANAQSILDISTIEDIVKNETEYFNDIVEMYRNDDPYLDFNDIAMVYYGQAFLPGFNPAADENEGYRKIGVVCANIGYHRVLSDE